MTDLLPGHANVFFEVKFDKLTPDSLRAVIASECTAKLNQLVPAATRQTWLNKPYTGGSDPAELLDFVSKLMNLANPNPTPSPTPKNDFYCWFGEFRLCYSPFEVKENGVPVVLTIEAGGLQVDCEVIAIMAIVPE